MLIACTLLLVACGDRPPTEVTTTRGWHPSGYEGMLHWSTQAPATSPQPSPQPVENRQVRRGHGGGCLGRTLESIAAAESGGDYGAQNRSSSASGKYQVLSSTWGGYGGYSRARDAPPEVQEAQAHELYAAAGARPWVASC